MQASESEIASASSFTHEGNANAALLPACGECKSSFGMGRKEELDRRPAASPEQTLVGWVTSTEASSTTSDSDEPSALECLPKVPQWPNAKFLFLMAG